MTVHYIQTKNGNQINNVSNRGANYCEFRDIREAKKYLSELIEKYPDKEFRITTEKTIKSITFGNWNKNKI